MRRGIQNTLTVTCNDVDLTSLSNIEFYIRQFDFFGCYTPTVISPREMNVIVPLEDAQNLHKGKIELQFAFTYANGDPDASDVIEMDVKDLLKAVGYGTV